MKKISEVTKYLFVIFVVFGTLIKFEIIPLNTSIVNEAKNKDRLSQYYGYYNITAASKHNAGSLYHANGAAREIFSANPNKPMTSWEGETEQRVCNDCKEAISIISSERSDRESAESKNEKRATIIFISTSIVGLFLVVLKAKFFSQKWFKNDEDRDSLVVFLEFFFAMFILYVSTFF